jgi:molybdenum cofactor guanylyltransferase
VAELTIAIMAGGASERMPVDKALLRLASGETMLERVVTVSLATGYHVIVVGRRAPEGWKEEDVRFVPDASPGLGPIGGLVTSLEFAGDDVLAVGCDMPRMTTDALCWLADASAKRSAPSGIASTRDGKLEPLFSVYGSGMLEMACGQIAQGRRSLHGLIELAGMECLAVPAPFAACLQNINTPADLATLNADSLSPNRQS